MGEVVNLNRFRKARARAGRAEAAERNRALHGRTKAERQQDAAERARTDRTLDGARRDDSEA